MKRLELDATTSAAMAARIWQTCAGPLTMLLMVFCFTDQERGLYWAFLSTLGIQVFAELGFQWVILNVASHEWSQLAIDREGRPIGNERALARLASLSRLVLVWYATASIILVPLIWSIGYHIYSQKANVDQWLAPWTVLSLLSGMLLTVSACVSVLEGCNQVAAIQRVRLGQVISGNFVVWFLMLQGAGLWVAVAATGVQLVWELCLVGIVYRRFWKELLKIPLISQNRISWRTEIWPLQWNIAIQSISHYFAYQAIVLVMFHRSTVLGGQMGMTWQILNASLMIAATWLQVRAPYWGTLVAKREFTELDKRFRRVAIISSAVLIIVLGLFSLTVIAANALPMEFAQKIADGFLPSLSVAIF